MIILFPNHQPVWFDMAFPLSDFVSRQFMGSIGLRQPAISLKDGDCCCHGRNIQATLLTTLDVFLKTIGVLDSVHQDRIWAIISSALCALYTRPLATSSIASRYASLSSGSYSINDHPICLDNLRKKGKSRLGILTLIRFVIIWFLLFCNITQFRSNFQIL